MKINFFLKKTLACPLCNNKTSVDKFLIKQLVWDVQVKKCNLCGMVYKAYIPNDNLLKYIYSPTYIHFNNSDVQQCQKKDNNDVLSSRVKRLGVKTKNCRHLDYGCGSGAFVKSSLSAGWDSYGCDPFLPNNVDILLKDRLYKVDILDKEAIDILGYFDVISMWAVTEHLTNPLSTFKEISLMLKPGGRLVFNWPNGDSIIAKKNGNKWSMALLLEHLTFITPKSTKWLADNLDLRLIKISYCGSPYPFGKVENPGLKDQGIEKLPFNIESTELVNNKITPLTKNTSILKDMIQNINQSGNFANFLRSLIHISRLGDHLEVVMQKRK
jgi:2-polyprenyl-3-methyl-5-hydroxy-6-metoxy-1,4-benzoquinol methylase